MVAESPKKNGKKMTFEERMKMTADAIHKIGQKLLVIGQPMGGQSTSVHRDTYLSCMEVTSPINAIDLYFDHGLMTLMQIINQFPIDYNRNKFVEDCLNIGADYLMFMDMDQTFPGRTINMLMEYISDEHPVVCGMYYVKKEPFSPVIGRYVDYTPTPEQYPHFENQGFIDPNTGKQTLKWRSVAFFDPNEPFYCDAIGMGCVLMKADVFKKLKKPYFRYSYDPELGDPSLLKLSEDMYFCSQLKHNNIPIVCDPRIQCGHIMTVKVDYNIFASYRDAQYAALDKENPDKAKEIMSKIIDVRKEQTNGNRIRKTGQGTKGSAVDRTAIASIC